MLDLWCTYYLIQTQYLSCCCWCESLPFFYLHSMSYPSALTTLLSCLVLFSRALLSQRYVTCLLLVLGIICLLLLLLLVLLLIWFSNFTCDPMEILFFLFVFKYHTKRIFSNILAIWTVWNCKQLLGWETIHMSPTSYSCLSSFSEGFTILDFFSYRHFVRLISLSCPSNT